jgi:hypothetical protein
MSNVRAHEEDYMFVLLSFAVAIFFAVLAALCIFIRYLIRKAKRKIVGDIEENLIDNREEILL